MKGNYDTLRDGLKAQVVIVDEKLKAKREAEEKAATEKAAAAVKVEGGVEKPADGDAKDADKKDGDKKDDAKKADKDKKPEPKDAEKPAEPAEEKK
jgi:hypothetical protein